MRSSRYATALASIAALAAGAACAQPISIGERQTITSIRDCQVGYRIHRSVNPVRESFAVIIAHGFLRNGEFMRGWAEAIANAGLVGITTDLCASATGDGRHADNGVDLVALRRALGLRDVVYVGVSAGGLAALVAASQDVEATRGVLLLDPTNAGGQARAAAGRVQAPVAALVSRPQVCNAWRNIDRALETLADVTIVPLGRVSHCEFEWPTDRFCRTMCMTLRSEASAPAQSRIRTAGLAFVQAIARGDEAALAMWKASLADVVTDVSPPGDSVPTQR